MHPIIVGRLVFGGLGLIFSLIFFALLAAVAGAAPTDDTSLPPYFSLPAGHHALFATPASGNNVYQCVSTADGFAWELKGVNATLLDSDGHPLGTQDGASSWSAVDGSSISGRITKTVDAGAYGDALYTITSTSAGGVLSQISDVVRDHVVGGQPPSKVCDQSTLRQSVNVPFKADYVFFEAAS